jgi:ADP-heptose:LPS heptosyltransferase
VDPDTLRRLRAAEALANAGRLTEAESDCRALLDVAPEAGALLGIILARRQLFAEARAFLEAAVRARGEVPQWHHELAALWRRSFRLDEALAAARRAVALDARNPRYMKGLAQVHFDRGEAADARALLLETLAIAPDDFDAHLAMAHALLSAGEFLPGWAEYEWRLRSPLHRALAPPMQRPAWNGMRLPGKRLLLVADQGHGDAIQFARFVGLAATRCAEVVVLCRDAVVPLFARLAGVSACVTDVADVGPHAAYAFFGSLPFLFGTEIASLPGAMPYLAPDPRRRRTWRERLASRPGFRIGLVWAGNPENTSDWRRSIALDLLLGLRDVADTRFVSLQPHVAETDRAAMAALGVEDLGRALTDFGETAAAIANLDLVVTVDSAVAHLAGAMGVPVWVLVHHPADWRWLTEREDSPWYPSMRLFRQPRAGDWGTPIRRMVAALRELAR